MGAFDRPAHLPPRAGMSCVAAQATLAVLDEVIPRRLAGVCADGAERGGGTVFHAVAVGAWRAACGAEPGRRSAGWSDSAGDAVTCPRCLRKIK
jgi:hypothetical protein